MPPSLFLPPDEAIVALGANLGDAEGTLRLSTRRLAAEPRVELLAGSFVYDTAPVGPPQPRYRNGALRIRTRLEPEALLGRLLDVEREFGRVRSPESRWGPRPLDLDLLLFGGRVLATETLTLPHPRILERVFVLAPLRDVAPEFEGLDTLLEALGGAPERSSPDPLV